MFGACLRSQRYVRPNLAFMRATMKVIAGELEQRLAPELHALAITVAIFSTGTGDNLSSALA